MQKSSVSGKERKAPLATFDTEDLGEGEECILPLNNTPMLRVEKAETSLNCGCSDSENNDTGGEFSFGSESASARSMNTNYRKFSNGNESQCSQTQENGSNSSVGGNFSKGNNSDSDSDSSESDSEYIRSGYISVNQGKVFHRNAKHYIDSHEAQRSVLNQENYSSSDSTPFSSPILPRVSITSLLSELQNEKVQSKRKALEKRIQRLQVTNTPVERPRSTTPINIHTFDEYKEFDSPEKSNCLDGAEKLKIKLPGEEFSPKIRSPRKSRSTRKDCSMFNFNEDHLFSKTTSALIVQKDNDTGLSPKRILLPPALSPSSSPIRSPSLGQKTENIQGDHTVGNVNSDFSQVSAQGDKFCTWDAFSEASGLKRNSNPWNDKSDAPSSNVAQNFFKSDAKNNTQTDQNTPDITINIDSTDHADTKSSREFAQSICDKLFSENDEVLTVQIAEIRGEQFCDISCDDNREHCLNSAMKKKEEIDKNIEVWCTSYSKL
ncbi:hypothetical protein FSP39_018277 [Pinctada imbricata]|uniref:Uncharacterized protein n=1 Tax=Pinctada imbricata TaxID=66713 RepID=A0AA89BT94_PINIB|nr:hypothetical protein FSP39_018277 [Pinctada imbricata]